MDEEGKGGGMGDWEVAAVVREDIHLCVLLLHNSEGIRQIVCVSFSVLDISYCKGLLSKNRMCCVYNGCESGNETNPFNSSLPFQKSNNKQDSKTTPLHSLSTHDLCVRLIALALHLVSWSKRILRAARSLWMKPLCERKSMAAATS